MEDLVREPINPKRCLVPNCPNLPSVKMLQRTMIPLCMTHSVRVWKVVADLNGKPMKDNSEPKVTKARNLPRDGDIYIARVNGLVKIGWSSRLYERLRSYGPGIEVLCHYPGTVADEKALHHKFRPFLANGREWFTEHQMIADHVAAMIEAHGKPQVIPDWTSPSDKPTKPRYWRGAA